MLKKFLAILSISLISFVLSSQINADEAKPSETSVREKVMEKIENTKNKSKAIIGTVTDKTEDTLQIKNIKGEIQFISVKQNEISFVNTISTPKAVKYTDIGLGDFVIAMGTLSKDESIKENGNNVLEAKRILVTKEIEPTERKIIFGNVVKIEKKILYLKTASEDIQLEFPKKWKGPEISEISENDRIAVIAITSEGKSVIRTIAITN